MTLNIDFLEGSSDVAQRLLACNFDHNALRPFIDNGACYINNGKAAPRLVNNALLTKDEWIHLDKAVTTVARERLGFVQDLQAKGLVYNLPNAMGKTVLQYQNVSDSQNAKVSMDGLSKGDNDRPLFDLTSMPIPIIHSDWSLTSRELATGRQGGTPIDTTQAENASRKVAETVEQLALGTYGTYTFGGGNLYGLCNAPYRVTDTYSDWGASSATGATRLQTILDAMTAARGVKRFGPYGLYLGANLAPYLDEDYKAESDITLRQRILAIGKDGTTGYADNQSGNRIQFLKVLDYLGADDIVLVQMTSDVIQEVVGMNTTSVQWTTEGGFRFNFKVMAIMLPRVRFDYNHSCGIVHLTKASA